MAERPYKWPVGFTPDPTTPLYLQKSFAQDHFAEQVRVDALAWAKANLADETVEWAEPFADWAADRARYRLDNFTKPPFARWWKTYYAEPIPDEDEDEDE